MVQSACSSGQEADSMDVLLIGFLSNCLSTNSRREETKEIGLVGNGEPLSPSATSRPRPY